MIHALVHPFSACGLSDWLPCRVFQTRDRLDAWIPMQLNRGMRTARFEPKKSHVKTTVLSMIH